MLKEQREEQIQLLLEQHGSVEVSQLCHLFNVTKMTIRRDLDKLEAEGKITRTHGGAVLNNTDILLEKPLYMRLNTNIEHKDRIAKKAASMISDGQKIFLSSGTTLFTLAKQLDNSRRLLVVTDGLNVALELSKRTNISIIIIGGELRSNTLATTGSFAENMIREFKFETAYIGVTSISADGYLYHGSLVEIGLYKALNSISHHIVVMADSSKLGKDDFVCVGRLKPGDTLITDDNALPEMIKLYKDRGINVVLS
ncbi:MAG: DeoR/GlpR family DNA-binding transcription regulator [Eubacterium sp.]